MSDVAFVSACIIGVLMVAAITLLLQSLGGLL